MLELLARRWWVMLIRGIAAMVMGLITILWPGMTLQTLVFIFGAFTAADGLTAIWLGFTARSDGRVWWEMVAVGIIALVAGVMAALWPGLTVLVFVFVIGLFAMLRGVVEIAAAIQLQKVIDDEWMLVLSGVLSLLFGSLLIARPGEGALAMTELIGALMIVLGAMAVGLAMRLRRALHHILARHRGTAAP